MDTIAVFILYASKTSRRLRPPRIAPICVRAFSSINVVLRYVFSSGISWVEEISKDVLMTAFTFLSMAIGVKLDSHINVDLFPKGTPQWVTTVLLKLKYLVLTVIGFVLFYYGIF